MESYFIERSKLFHEGSEFSCPDFCKRYGCKEANLHVSISLVDLAAIFLTSGEKILELFGKDCKVGFDPFEGQDPCLGRVFIELEKPCSFLDRKECSVYRGRLMAWSV